MKRTVLLLLLVPMLAGAAENLRISSSLDAMGTTFTVVAYDASQRKLETALDMAFEEIARVDAVLSNYKPDSEWSRVNREAANGPVPVSPELFHLLSDCVAYSRASEGSFDITVGPLLKTWGFYQHTGRVPHRGEIRAAMARVGYEAISLNPEDRSVRFLKPGLEMDPGGIGKGYAVDRVVDVLRRVGITSALVSAGTSSIYALGAPPGEPGWTVAIRNPKNPEKSVEEVVLRDESISTSGNYEKFFRAGGTVYSHIFDPVTGYPATGILSVSVVTPKTIDSEAWTKPYFVRGREWAVQNRQPQQRVFICEDGWNASCAWLQ